MKEIALSADSLEISIDQTKILRKISLEFPKSQVIGLLGPSGAGKTTLIRTIVGLQKITSGSLTILGKPAASPELRSLVGYMAQDPDVYSDLTVRENLKYFAKLLGADISSVDKLIKQVDLKPQSDQLVETLSGGQMVRVSLAVALLGSPEMIILDEPTVGLDPVLRKKLWEDFHALAEKGATVIVTSHVMDEAARCDHLVLIREGHILAADTPSALQKKTKASTMEGAFLKLIGGKR